MHRTRRLLPLLLLGLAAWGGVTLPARAQTPAARFAFADTTLLRDTLDLSFSRLFVIADSLRVTPDTLRAIAVRYDWSPDRIAFLADSLRMPVDSVGPVLQREQFNPLAHRTASSTTFTYNTTYTMSRQVKSWGNSATYDLVRGSAVLHNVTTVGIDRIPGEGATAFHRSNVSNTEFGLKVLPDIAMGMRMNLQQTESFALGGQRTTSKNDYQVSMQSRHAFRDNRNVALNVFGGPFTEPRNSLNNATKEGLGTNFDGRVEYAPKGWYTFDLDGSGSYRRGRAQVPGRMTFDTRDAQWNSDGTLNLFPQSRATVRVTATAGNNRTERPTYYTLIAPIPGSNPPASDTTRIDQLVQEPSGTSTIQTALQLQGGRFGNLNLAGNLGHTTNVLVSEQKEGLAFDQQETHDKGIQADGQLTLGKWSLDGHYTDSRPADEGPRRSVVNVTLPNGAVNAVTVSYRERGTTANRDLNGSLTRQLTPRLTLKARGDIGLSSYRYVISDSSYLALTAGQHVTTSDPHDDYHQNLRVETTYSTSSDLSTTVALELGDIVTTYVRADRSASTEEDRLYRAEWLWTFRLLPDLTANQRNQVSATYTHFPFAPATDRLSMTYTTVTTLNARITPRLTFDLTHNANYGPNGAYARADNGLDYFLLSDASRDYNLSGRLSYMPIQAIQFNLQPIYIANDRTTRNGTTNVPTLHRRELQVSGGCSINLRVGSQGKLSGSVARNIDSRRDTPYSGNVPQPQPRSDSDYWSGQLQFTWSLQ